ncbi:P-loop containing nucleoside triphosphate hydrolase protein [Thozetella sp. PMI_491]|nr:P-loop containing nucleoside triphosphate hydrolase protein [Thozetella sp. PMI_491]
MDRGSVNCDALDDSFGPAVPLECRGGFDFTLLFEQAFFMIVPCSLFLPLATYRVRKLYRAESLLSCHLDCLYMMKLAAIGVYTALQLAILVLWSSDDRRTKLSIPSAILALVSASFAAVLSHHEHAKSYRPSTFIAAFLAPTLLLDATVLRTLWLRNESLQLAVTFSVGVIFKLVSCILEAQGKASIVRGGKNLSPETLSGPYSRIFYWWLTPLLIRGFRQTIQLEDLSSLEPKMTSAFLGEKMRHSWESTNKTKRWALLCALCSALRWEIAAPVVSRIFLISFNFAQPFLITTAITFVQEPPQAGSEHTGYGLIGAAAVIYMGIAITNGQFNYQLYRTITSVRGCLVALVYAKTLELPSTDVKSAASITLMSTDVDRIALTVDKVFELWAGTIEVILAVYLLERQIGWACAAPLVLSLVCFVGNSVVSKFIPRHLKAWNQAIQARVALTSSTLRHIRPIRMMGLGPDTSEALQDARLSSSFVFLIFLYASQFSSDGGLTAARAFATLSLLELLTSPLGNVLSALPFVTAATACFGRIQDYLRLEEQPETAGLEPEDMETPLASAHSPASALSSNDEESGSIHRVGSTSTQTGIVASFDEVDLKYSDNSPVLHNLQLDILKGSLVMVVGPVGSGKSTLLKAVAGDLAPSRGSVRVMTPEVAYCQQTPWLTNTTVRRCIMGQTDLVDETWYQKVVKSCALDEDIGALPGGSDWVVGSGGISLSGGQKQRIALARAVYSKNHLLVLDSPFSALDQKTEQAVFDSLLSKDGLLRQDGATVIMATHTLRHLAFADKIVVLGDGGKVDRTGTFDELQDLPILQRSMDFDERQTIQASKVNEQPASNGTKKSLPQPASGKALKIKVLGDFSDYFKSMGWSRMFCFLVITALFIFCSRFSLIWLQYYVGGKIADRGLFIGIYFAFNLAAITLYLIGFWWMMIVLTPISSADLHWQLVTGVFRAPLAFFSKIDSGVVLNRFSQDMHFLNAQLPISTKESITSLFLCLVQLILISVGSGYLAIVIPLLLLVVYALQRFYLGTSRQLRMLELEHKSPVYSFFTDTIEGLPTIRAFGWSRSFLELFYGRLDESQRPVYFLYLIQRWLNFVFDVLVACLAVLLLVFATQFRNTSTGPALGVAMVNILSFSQGLGQLVWYYTELETCMGAISRIKEYAAMKPEDDPAKMREPPSTWPSKGVVRFCDVSAAYGAEDELVLKDVSFQILDGQMVGISGRTGSGKSSLFLALLGFLELRSGAIYLDGVDISTVPRETLRSRLTVIPQDPFFLETRSIRATLTGSRANISDAALIAAVEKVGLLQHLITSLRPILPEGSRSGVDVALSAEEAKCLLDAKMKSLPLSPGQLQLFCLARPLVLDSKVVLLDEVTSAVDHATEEKLQEVLLEGMEGKTVIIIAHRPEIAKECSVGIEMEAGRVTNVTSRSA